MHRQNFPGATIEFVWEVLGACTPWSCVRTSPDSRGASPVLGSPRPSKSAPPLSGVTCSASPACTPISTIHGILGYLAYFSLD